MIETNADNRLDSIEDGADDDEPVTVEDVTSAFVTDTDWTTETILSQMRRGNIRLNPRFQRRDAWDRGRKSRFIESLILGLPIPQLVLAEDKRKRGSFIVLDGKQRLLTIAQFAKGSSFDHGSEPELSELRLGSLDVRGDLQKFNLETLEKDPKLIDDLNGFLNQTIRTVVVRNWPAEDFLNLVFLRLNTGSVALSPQELRQALHPGPFTDFLDDYASESTPLQQAMGIDRPDFRMRDVEILLRFFAMKDSLFAYRGNLRKFLDDASDKLNSSWADSETKIRSWATEFDRSIETTMTIFGKDAFRRWNPERGRYENRFNRAVFDIMAFYFSEPPIRQAAEEHKETLEYAFRQLSEQNPSFVESMQTTTKTIEALHTRLAAWGNTLSNTLKIDFPVPSIGADGLFAAD